MEADRTTAEFTRSLVELLFVGVILVLGVAFLGWSSFDVLFLAWADGVVFVFLGALSLLVGPGSIVRRVFKFLCFVLIAPFAAFLVTGFLMVFFTQPDTWADGQASLRTEDYELIAERINLLPIVVAVVLGLWMIGLYFRWLITGADDRATDQPKSLVGHVVVRWGALFLTGIVMAEGIDKLDNELLVILALVFGRLVGMAAREVYTPWLWWRRVPPSSKRPPIAHRPRRAD